MPHRDLVVCEQQRQEPRLAVACRHLSYLAEFEIQYGIIQTKSKCLTRAYARHRYVTTFSTLLKKADRLLGSQSFSRSQVDKISLGTAIFITNLGRILTRYLARVSVALVRRTANHSIIHSTIFLIRLALAKRD